MMTMGVDYAHGLDQCVCCTMRRDAAGVMSVVDVRRIVRRTVGARRARKLRRKGVLCHRVAPTCTGKARYAYYADQAAIGRIARAWLGPL